MVLASFGLDQVFFLLAGFLMGFVGLYKRLRAITMFGGLLTTLLGLFWFEGGLRMVLVGIGLLLFASGVFDR